jgi:hypothetical protein
LLADHQAPGDRLLGKAGSVRGADLVVAFTSKVFIRVFELCLAFLEAPREVR